MVLTHLIQEVNFILLAKCILLYIFINLIHTSVLEKRDGTQTEIALMNDLFLKFLKHAGSKENFGF